MGALTIETARAAIADAGLTVADVDGFVTASLFPSAGAHAAVDGVSLVSANWLAGRLGVNPSYAAGFQGFGQLPGAVAMAVNAIASGAADYVLVHRALHNPAGSYHANPMTEARGDQQWTVPQGYFGPLAMIALPYTEYLQRYGATREAMAAVVSEARKNGARIPWSYWHGRPLQTEDYLSESADHRSDLPARLRHPGRRRGLLPLHFGRTCSGPASSARVRGRVRHGRASAAPAPPALALGRHHGSRDGDRSATVGTVRDQTD